LVGEGEIAEGTTEQESFSEMTWCRHMVPGISIRVSRDREIKTRKVQGVRCKEITKSDLFISILAQFCMSNPQFDPNWIAEKLDLTDPVKKDRFFPEICKARIWCVICSR
jgi:hypothetical protein